MSTLLSQLAIIIVGDSSTTPVTPGIMTWVADIATTIVNTPILLLTTGFLVLGKPVEVSPAV